MTLKKIDEANLPTTILSEISIDTDEMYAAIGKTLSAIDNTTVDGESRINIDADLQANANKRFLPDTEMEMVHTNAVPMSDADLKVFKIQQERMQTLQYRKAQLSIPTKTLAEITGARVRAAYRLIKYMSHIRGIGEIGTPLIFSMGSSNAQINLFELPIPYDPTVGWYRGLDAVRNLLAQANDGPHEYTFLLNNIPYKTKGMSILPPPLHDGYMPSNGKANWQYRRMQHTPKDYDAEKDVPLATYLNICELLVRHLSIGYEDVDEQAAIVALLNPKIARLAWPCRADIETFEEYVLMPYIGRVVTEKAQDGAIDEIKNTMGLTHAEAFDFIESYKTYAQHANVYNPEKERSVMINKLGRLAEECSDAGMVTTQLNTQRTILQILGLTRHEEDSNIDKRVSLEHALEAEIIEQGKEQEIEQIQGE